jgi:hypothetical protein
MNPNNISFTIPASTSSGILQFTMMAQFLRHNLAEMREWIANRCAKSLAPSLINALTTLEEKEVLIEKADYQQIMLDAV